MKLIVGLGNPDSQYQNTRHNFGFAVLDYWRNLAEGFSPWRNSEPFKAQLSEGEFNGQKIILAKPQTYMNRSGRAVKSLADFYKINLDDLWLLHDDLALPLGALRLSQNAGPAGHKGVQSVIETLGTKNFGRWRLGIAPMKKNFLFSFWQKLQPAEKFVLQKFTADETPLVQSAIQKASDALNIALQESFSQAQTRFN